MEDDKIFEIVIELKEDMSFVKSELSSLKQKVERLNCNNQQYGIELEMHKTYFRMIKASLLILASSIVTLLIAQLQNIIKILGT